MSDVNLSHSDGVEQYPPRRNEDHQHENQRWWTEQTMSYDWKDKIDSERFSAEWFLEADQRFLHGARLFTGAPNPFEQLIDIKGLQGKRVLEIGCGMGMHSEMMLRAGARLTSIDLSPTSVEATSRRLALAGLEGDVRQHDALDIASLGDRFDLVWSWGVLHHSSHTARAVRAAAAVLNPGGELKLMVYHLGGVSAYMTLVRRYLIGFWSGRDIDELLWRDADGYTARFYTRDSFADMLAGFFADVDVRVFGQDADVVALPRQIRGWLLNRISQRRQIELASARGSMIYAAARRPL